MAWKLSVRRFIGPVIAAYLLHWGIWALTLQVEQIVMSALTRIFNFLGDIFGTAHIEAAMWSVRLNAGNAVAYGLLPVAIGLLAGFWVLQRKRKLLRTTS